MKISVIMPAFNAEKYIKDAIDSILSQTVSDLELIIVNDGSMDRTEELILEYDDSRIKYIKNEENLQLPKTLNKAMDFAKGDFIARMDADDISHPRRFEAQLDFFEKNSNVDICGTWMRTIGAADEIGRRPSSHLALKAYLLFGVPLFHPTVMFRRSVMKDIKYSDDYIAAEDYGLWVDLIDKYIFSNLEEVLLDYRVHANNTPSSRASKSADKLKLIMLERIGCQLDESEKSCYLRLVFPGDGSVDDALKLFHKVYDANLNSKYFEQSELGKVLANRIWAVILYNISNGLFHTLHNIKKYRNSFFYEFRSFDRIEIVKTLLKSVDSQFPVIQRARRWLFNLVR